MCDKYPIHIAFCINDSYAQYIVVTIKSIAESHEKTHVTIHILTDYISDKNKSRLLKEVEEYGDAVELVFYFVNDNKLKCLEAWSVYTWYRLLLPDVLPESVNRVLYLDADTIVKDDLSALFQTDMVEKSIAAVVDYESFGEEAYIRCQYSKEKRYICAGVMLINLDYWRENEIANKIIDWAVSKNGTLKLYDQDAINHVCQDTKIMLPLRYGIVDALFTLDCLYKDSIIELSECLSHPAIIHYAGKAPWGKDAAIHPMSDEWDSYNMMLKSKVSKKYKSKGLLLLKIMIWDILHPFTERRLITKEEIVSRINEELYN